MKVKGFYKGVVPVYITEKEGIIYLKGTNWFWEKILTWCFNLDVYLGNVEEVDYEEFVKQEQNKLKPSDFK
jgi:hypothetical protein